MNAYPPSPILEEVKQLGVSTTAFAELAGVKRITAYSSLTGICRMTPATESKLKKALSFLKENKVCLIKRNKNGDFIPAWPRNEATLTWAMHSKLAAERDEWKKRALIAEGNAL